MRSSRSIPPSQVTPELAYTDADAHYERARAAGARIASPPTTYPFGERQYTAHDLCGHRWTFSESVADVDPRDWGGTLASEADAS